MSIYLYTTVISEFRTLKWFQNGVCSIVDHKLYSDMNWAELDFMNKRIPGLFNEKFWRFWLVLSWKGFSSLCLISLKYSENGYLLTNGNKAKFYAFFRSEVCATSCSSPTFYSILPVSDTFRSTNCGLFPTLGRPDWNSDTGPWDVSKGQKN